MISDFRSQDFRNRISEIRFHKSNFNKNRFFFFQKSDFRHDCNRCPQLTDSRTFTEGNFSTSVSSSSAFFPQNFTPRDAHCFWQWYQISEVKISEIKFQKTKIIFSEIRFLTWLLQMSLANRFKNLYRGQLFNFCLLLLLRFFFFLKISLLEMLIAFGNEHLKKGPFS